MARNEQLIRQHRLLQLLEASRFGRSLTELRDSLVEELGLDSLSERTVRRDLEALQAAGFDVDTHSVERGTVWKLGPRLERLPEIGASVTELLALSMGRDLLAPLAGTPYWHGIETLWNKMRSSLPDPVWRHFDEQRQGLIVRGSPPKAYGDKKGIVSTINRAILQHRVVEIVYQSASDPEPRPRNVHPYSLVLYSGSLYLVAAAVEDAPDRPLRHWKLDRFEKAEALDEWFTPRPDFDPSQHFQHSLGLYRAGDPIDVVIHVGAEAARWVVENPWHPDQSTKPNADGSLLLTLPGAYPEEVAPRVLALGDAVEVLEPASLRVRVAEALESTLRRYREEETR